MKKIFLLLVLFGSLFLIQNSKAVSGACSWHGGVNCNAGRDYDGSVICNDGWTDSMTSYEFTEKCKNDLSIPDLHCKKYSCYKPIAHGCMTEEDYQQEEVLLFRLGDTNSEYGKSKLEECRKQIDNYKKEISEYEECQTQSEIDYQKCWDTQYEMLDRKMELTCIQYKGPYSFFDSESGVCKCKNGYYENKNTLKCEKILDCSQNSSFSYEKGKCICKKAGYIMKNNICITHEENCQNSFGKNSYAVEGNNENSSCSCKDGYEWNKEKNFCTPKCPDSSYRESDILCKCIKENEKYNIILNSCEIIEQKKEMEQVEIQQEKIVKEEVKKNIINDKVINNDVIPEKPPINNNQIKSEAKPNDKINKSITANTTTENTINKATTTKQNAEENKIENKPQSQQDKPVIQKIKESTGSAVKHVVSFVKNVFSKLKFW